MDCSECGDSFCQEEEETLCWECTKRSYNQEGIRYLD